jgi:cell division protein FtsI/penicillin-binding protein 2
VSIRTRSIPRWRNKRRPVRLCEALRRAGRGGALLKKHFAGIFSYPEERRQYPQRSVAAQVVGYAGVDNRGLGGLELQYDRKLAGHPGKQTIVRDATGRAIDVISSSPVQEGAAVFTTIDHTIQANAEQVLRATVSKWGARDATAIVLDPSTGEGPRDGAGAGATTRTTQVPQARP